MNQFKKYLHRKERTGRNKINVYALAKQRL